MLQLVSHGVNPWTDFGGERLATLPVLLPLYYTAANELCFRAKKYGLRSFQKKEKLVCLINGSNGMRSIHGSVSLMSDSSHGCRGCAVVDES